MLMMIRPLSFISIISHVSSVPGKTWHTHCPYSIYMCTCEATLRITSIQCMSEEAHNVSPTPIPPGYADAATRRVPKRHAHHLLICKYLLRLLPT